MSEVGFSNHLVAAVDADIIAMLDTAGDKDAALTQQITLANQARRETRDSAYKAACAIVNAICQNKEIPIDQRAAWTAAFLTRLRKHSPARMLLSLQHKLCMLN